MPLIFNGYHSSIAGETVNKSAGDAVSGVCDVSGMSFLMLYSE